MSSHHPPRTLLASTAVLGVVGLLTSSCSSSSPAAGPHHGSRSQGLGRVVLASVQRATTTPHDATVGGALVRHVAEELYGPMTAGDAENATFSPTSIAVALSMLRAGGQGRSAAQLDRFLGSPDAATLARSMNGLTKAMATRNGTFPTSKDEHAKVTLRSANALWGQRGVQWEEPFLDTMAAQYGAGMRVVDYGDGDTARQAINGWVGKETEGKIPQLIPEGALTSDSRLTLTNAMYFKAPWNEAFTDDGQQPFTNGAGTTEKAPSMAVTTDLAYDKGSGWQSVTLPYAGSKVAMTIVVSDAGRLAAVERSWSTGLLDRLLRDQPSSRPVHLTMPKFDLRTKTLMNQVLKSLGVREPFDPATRDFEPMSHDPAAEPLSVGNVRHEATVTVDEKGTVAAAATSVEMLSSSARVEAPPLTLTVDHPFLFVIHDIATGAPLFVGRVSDPLQQ
ncbi:MAG TPA: serpin family protein [Acidimicrobiales bacterium]